MIYLFNLLNLKVLLLRNVTIFVSNVFYGFTVFYSIKKYIF